MRPDRPACALALSFLLLTSFGCTFQVGKNQSIVVIGPARVTESRVLDQSLRRAARVVIIQGLGFCSAATSLRAGFSLGYVRDLYVEIYSFEVLTERLSAWGKEEGPSSSLALVTSFAPVPDATVITRLRSVMNVGAGLNWIESSVALCAGYVDESWVTGEVQAPPVAFAWTGDAIRFIPFEMAP